MINIKHPKLTKAIAGILLSLTLAPGLSYADSNHDKWIDVLSIDWGTHKPTVIDKNGKKLAVKNGAYKAKNGQYMVIKNGRVIKKSRDAGSGLATGKRQHKPAN